MSKDSVLTAYGKIWTALCRARYISESLEELGNHEVEVWDMGAEGGVPVEREVRVSQLLSAE